MKYKVGDKVKIREDLKNDEIYGSGYWDVTSDMVSYGGMIATIIKCEEDSYQIDVDNGFYSWVDEMFEEVKVKEVDDNEQARTVDVGFHLDHCGHRVIKNVWQGGWAIECKERSIFFTTYDCKNQYTLPLNAIDWVIPHED